MRHFIAPDKFKGSLSASQVADAIERALMEKFPDSHCEQFPISDGGEGFSRLIGQALGLKEVHVEVEDALGRPCTASYFTDHSVAVIEMSQAAGLWRISPEVRNPLASSTYGVGQMILHAIQHGRIDRLILGLGGSATNDGGAGMAAALGIRFLDASGVPIKPTPQALAHQVVSIESSALTPLPALTVACDVDNPLLGPEGATQVYGPQKGLQQAQLAIAESALERLVELSQGHVTASLPGSGAAGGIAFGLRHFLKASLVPGFSLLSDVLDLPSKLQNFDVVWTGEGCLDSQSLRGKAPIALGSIAHSLGIPCRCVCGHRDADLTLASTPFLDILAITDLTQDRHDALARAEFWIETLVRNANFTT